RRAIHVDRPDPSGRPGTAAEDRGSDRPGRAGPDLGGGQAAAELAGALRHGQGALAQALAHRAHPPLPPGPPGHHPRPPPPPPPADPQLAAQGARLLRMGEGFSCVQCHALGSAPAEQVFEREGVNLAVAAARVRHEYFRRWLLDAPRIDAETKMPKWTDAKG